MLRILLSVLVCLLSVSVAKACDEQSAATVNVDGGATEAPAALPTLATAPFAEARAGGGVVAQPPAARFAQLSAAQQNAALAAANAGAIGGACRKGRLSGFVDARAAARQARVASRQASAATAQANRQLRVAMRPACGGPAGATTTTSQSFARTTTTGG